MWLLRDCSDGDGADEGSYTVTRTFVVTAEDNCGNTTTLSCDQTLTFTDEEGPMFDGNPDELYPAPISCGDMPDPYDINVLPLPCQRQLRQRTVLRDFASLPDLRFLPRHLRPDLDCL